MSGEERGAWEKRLKQLLKKYRFVVLVIVIGVALLLLPTGEKREDPEPQSVDTEEDIFSVTAMERRLESSLSRIDGAGTVDVVLTVRSGARAILAQDGKTTQRDGEVDSTTSTVIVSNENRGEETIALQQLSPQYQGALVVCSGGDDPAVRLQLTDAISALTGLGTDKISICKGK